MSALLAATPFFNVGFAEVGAELLHHFGDDGSGVYIKQTTIPAGVSLAMHTHTFTHKSVLASGCVTLTADGERRVIDAPAVMTMHEGVEHEVFAHVESVWLCIHATDETDPNRIDHTLVRA